MDGTGDKELWLKLMLSMVELEAETLLRWTEKLLREAEAEAKRRGLTGRKEYRRAA